MLTSSSVSFSLSGSRGSKNLAGIALLQIPRFPPAHHLAWASHQGVGSWHAVFCSLPHNKLTSRLRLASGSQHPAFDIIGHIFGTLATKSTRTEGAQGVIIRMA